MCDSVLIPDVGKWLDDHHRVAVGAKGEVVHIFATKQGNVFGGDDVTETETYEVNFALGPMAIRIIVVTNPSARTLNICTYGKLPLLPEFGLGCAVGVYDQGITIKFDLSTTTGSFTFYVKDGWLWVHHNVTVLGEDFQGDIKLIPLPS